MMQPYGATSSIRTHPPTQPNQSSGRNPLSYLKKLGSSNAAPSALNIPPRVPSSQGHRQNSSVGSISKQERGSSAVQGEEYKALEKGLAKFAQRTSHKVEVIKSVLATWLKKNSAMTADMISGRSLDQGRTILLRWWTVLLEEMPDAGYADRSIFFETVIGVMTRVEFQEFDDVGLLSSLPPDSNIDLGSLRRYRDLTYMTLDFAVDRLNQKGVYSNMISFCAKVLAHSFFKLPDVGNKLVRALPVRKGCLRRIVEEMGGNESNASLNRNVMMSSFPVHLEELCYKDAKSWWRRIETHDDGIMADMASTGVRIEMSGNWIRRWQSDDSELFFSFYKYYHAVLREYFDKRGGISVMFQYMPDGDMIYTESNSQPRSLAYLYAPGYAHLAAFFLEKIDSLIHREIYSVTTLTPNASRDSLMVNASALMLNGGGGGRPKVLEVANKRLSDTIAHAARQFGGIFKDMSNVWFRAVVKRTSLWDAEGVFSLVDFADALCLELTAPLKSLDKSTDEKEKDKDKDKENRTDDENSHFNVDVYFDVTYLFRIITLVLTTTDHTISVMRILSFIYSHFAQLTRSGDAKRMLCLDVLLRADIFDAMFLHWGPMCRAYFMRLLVWRVSRIGLKPPSTDGDKKNGKNVIAFEPINDGSKVLTGEILRLLDKRLESVRKRHDRFVEEELGMSEEVKAADSMFPPSSPSPQIPTSPTESIPYSPLSNASSNSDGGTPKKKQKKRPPPLLSESLMTPKVKSPTIPVDRDALLAAGKSALAGNVDAFRQHNSSSGSLPLPSTAASNSSMMSDGPIPKKAMKRFGLGAGVGSDMGKPMRGSSRQSMDSNKNRLAKLRQTFKGAGDRLMRTASNGRVALIGALKADRGSHPRQMSEPAHYASQQAPQTVYTYQGPIRSSSMNSHSNSFTAPESFSQTASPRHGQFSSHLKLSPNDYRSDLRKSKASLDEEAAIAHASRVMEAEGRRDPYGLEHPPTPKSRRESGYWMDKNGENQLLVEVDESQEQQEAQRRANHEQALNLLETKPPIPDIQQADVIKLLGLPEESPTRTVDPIAEAEAALMGNRVSQLKTNQPLPPLPSGQRNGPTAAANRLSLGDIGLGKSFFSFEFEGSKGPSAESSSTGSLSAFGEADDFFASVLGASSSSSLSSDNFLAPVSQTSIAKRRSAAYMAGLGIDTSDDPLAPPSPMFSPPSPGAEVPRLSKHISNRQSLLPPDAYDFLSTMENAPAVPTIPKEHASANTQSSIPSITATATQNNSKPHKQAPSIEQAIVPAAPVKLVETSEPSKPSEPPKLTVGKSNVPLDVGMASMNLNTTLENIPSTPTGYPRQRHIYAKRALVEYEEVVEEYVQWGAQCRKQGLATGKGKADVNEALSALIPQLMVEWPRYFYGG